jgi:hypothetical protein
LLDKWEEPKKCKNIGGAKIAESMGKWRFAKAGVKWKAKGRE